MLGIVNVELFADRFCYIPLNSVGLYSGAQPSFLVLWSFQDLLLSFVRGAPEKPLVWRQFSLTTKAMPFWGLYLMPHAVWVISTLASGNRNYSQLHMWSASYLFYCFLVVHFLDCVVSYTFTDQCSAEDSRGLTADLQSSLCVCFFLVSLTLPTNSTHLDLL